MAGAGLWAAIKSRLGLSIEEKIKRCFDECGLYIKHGNGKQEFPKLLSKETKDYGYLFVYSIPIGLAFSDFRREKEVIEQATGGEIEMWVEGNLYMKIFTHPLPHFVKYTTPDLSKYGLGLPAGHSRAGMEIIDLADDITPFYMTGGFPGGGKTCQSKEVILAWNENYTPDQLGICMGDLKAGVEYVVFKNAPLTKMIATTENQLEHMLHMLDMELAARGEMFREVGVTKISEYHKKGFKLPRLVLVIDEFAELSSNHDAQEIVLRLCRMGRFVGIHTWISTQRATRDVVDPNIKAMIQSSCIFRVKNRINSEVFVDSHVCDASLLPPIPGRAILVDGDRVRQIQVPYISDDDILKRLKKLGGKADGPELEEGRPEEGPREN